MNPDVRAFPLEHPEERFEVLQWEPAEDGVAYTLKKRIRGRFFRLGPQAPFAVLAPDGLWYLLDLDFGAVYTAGGFPPRPTRWWEWRLRRRQRVIAAEDTGGAMTIAGITLDSPRTYR